MRKKRKQSVTKPERWVRWRNDTGRLVELMVGKRVVEGWTPTTIRSLPESSTADALAAGLTRIGFSAS